MSTLLLIDGENFKGKIEDIFKSNNQSKPIWHEYDFKKLFDKALEGFKIDKVIFYFAKIKSHPSTPDKSAELIQEQRRVKTHLENQGFIFELGGIVTGHLQKGINGKEILIFKEKGVDVKIAVDMISWTCDKLVQEIILGSSDSDLIPALKEVRNRGTKCIYLGFEEKANKGVLYNCNRTILIRNTEVLECEKIQKTLPLK